MPRFELTLNDINLSAFLALTQPVQTVYNAQEGRANFVFEDCPALRDLMIRFERGEAAPAKDLLRTRTRLYHEASRVSGRGRR